MYPIILLCLLVVVIFVVCSCLSGNRTLRSYFTTTSCDYKFFKDKKDTCYCVAQAGREPSQKSIIPKKLMLTFKNTRLPSKVVTNWCKLNPSYEISFFTNATCEKFLREHYGKKHVKFFRNISRGMYKADFFRLCYLYKVGGMYADVDIEPIVPIDDYLNPHTTFFSVIAKNTHEIFQAMLGVTPNNPVIKMCIDSMMRKIPSRIKYPFPTRDVLVQILKYCGKDSITEGITRCRDQVFQLAKEICPKGEDYHECNVEYDRVRISNSRYPDYDRNHGFLSR